MNSPLDKVRYFIYRVLITLIIVVCYLGGAKMTNVTALLERTFCYKNFIVITYESVV